MTRPIVGRARRAGALGICCALLLALDALADADQTALEAALAGLKGETIHEIYRSRLDGIHFSADVRIQVGEGAARGERRLTVWRDDAGQLERLMARFEMPFDLRGVALLYLEGDERPSDYFLYQPASSRIRRIPSDIARQDIYGVDLEFFGFGLAQTVASEITGATIDRLGDRLTVRLDEVASEPNPRFEERRIWVDADNLLPMRIEHVRRGKITMLARTLEVRTIQGIPTPVRSVFERPLENEVVTLIVDNVDYEASIPQHYFSTLELIKER